MITAKTISGQSETGILLYFERETKLPKRTNFAHRQQLCFEMPLMVHGEALHKILLKFDITNFSRQPLDRFILKKTKVCWQNANEIQIFRIMNNFVSSKADWENKRVK